MRRIALVNQKGGCGKTMTAINLASFLALKGKRVLLMDLDPQGHVAVGLGIKPEEIEKSTYEVLTGESSLRDAARRIRDNFSAVLANVVLSAFEQKMAGTAGREYKLAEAVREIGDSYDYLLIDTPPSVGLLTFNALMAAEEAIIPIDSSYFSIQGLGKLLETIQLLKTKAGHGLSVRILATNVDQRTNFGKEVVEELRSHFPGNCFETVINTSTRLREAISHGKPIGEYDRSCRGHQDYLGLAEEVLKGEPAARSKSRVPPARTTTEKDVTPPTPTEKEIRLLLEVPGATRVQIAGDFNSWVAEDVEQVSEEGKQLWRKVLSLRPGSYQYKYLVDGNWISDPTNANKVSDSYGGVNSVITIG